MTKDRFSKWPLSKLPKSSETCFQSHYGPSQSSVTAYYALSRLVTFCWVHPVLLRPARFLICTVTAVANFLTVLKSGTAVTAITASQVCPSRRPALPHVHPVELSSVSQTKDKRQKFILVSELSAVGRIIDRIYRLYKSRKYLLSAPDNWPNKWDFCSSLLLVRQMIKWSNKETYTRVWIICCRPENWPNKCHLCQSRNCLLSAEQMTK